MALKFAKRKVGASRSCGNATICHQAYTFAGLGHFKGRGAMFKEIEREILYRINGEAEKLIQRYHSYHNRIALEELRNKNRLLRAPARIVRTPSCWGADRLFNPFYVAKHASAIAHSVATKIVQGSYAPYPPHIRYIPKEGGGKRGVCTYQVPDAAVSLWAYNNLIRKNLHRFSGFAYAYRTDRNAHFAVQDMYIDFKQRRRIFVAEYDFSKFFDSISHEYLIKQFDENGFLLSDLDRDIIVAFLTPLHVGIPQGTSLSLFLANVACWWLDHELEHLGVKFARYADDTVIWSTSYEAICRSYSLIEEYSKRSGVSINIKKSKGISLVTTACEISEMANPKESVEFLGYKVSLTSAAIKDGSVNKIKKHILFILHRTLIQPVVNNNWSVGRINISSGIDKDLGSAMHQIRRYLYGNLSEATLKKYERGMIRHITFKGLMSYYPFVDDVDQLKALDSWLANAIFRFVKARTKLLFVKHSLSLSKLPWSATAEDIVDKYKGDRYIDIPSFLRIHNAIRKGIIHQGPFFKDAYSY